MSLTDATRNQILNAAVLAPSPDNNQPWRLSFKDQELVVSEDPSHALPSDVGSMFGMLALGAAVENAIIQGTKHGLLGTARFNDDEAAPKVTIRFDGDSAADELAEFIPKRRTNRRPFKKTALPDTTLNRIADELKSDDPQIAWHTERAEIAKLAGMVAKTDIIRLQYEPFHQELFKQLRFTKDEAETTRDGLDARTLELPPGASTFLSWLRPWPRMRLMQRFGLAQALSVPSRLTTKSSGAIGTLMVSQRSREAYYVAGRAMQRIWVRSNMEGLEFHPLGSLPIFLAQFESAPERLNQKHQAWLQTMREEFYNGFLPHSEVYPVILFRIGLAKPPSQTSMRRPLAAFLD